MNPELKDLEKFKKVLFKMRIDLSKANKSGPWTKDQLHKVLLSLKGRKCADPIGMTYDLFKPGVIGIDLFRSLLLFCNKTKQTLQIVKALQFADITSIYKCKGSRLSLENERGIFYVVKI